jgi:diaminohydroxyphosphoribosylaminopyrimidine deaminase / 5-amino-6-(5-phosphoribosylamino)uracil reductase
MAFSPNDSGFMLRALELARRGQGSVEPNPMVGCVIVRDGEILGEGWHGRFGGAHAEREALVAAGQQRVAGATMYVTLEPCCHYGKTPPCTEAIVGSGIERVVAAMCDPFPQVAGGGIKQLTDAKIAVEVGLHEAEARQLNAPYLKFLATGRPWVIAKWAMTLDGKISAPDGSSRWISGAESRQIVHQLRGRMDAILVGRRTAQLDDPLLTSRCNEVPRIATRIVLDSLAQLASASQIVKTARQYPTLIATGPEAPEKELLRLADAGCEVVRLPAVNHCERVVQLLDELGHRRMTNTLVEGGSELLGALFDARQIDEVHVFIAPKVVGGQGARSPIGGAGIGNMTEALMLTDPAIDQIGGDIYVRGRIRARV